MKERERNRNLVRVFLVASFALAVLLALMISSGSASAHRLGYDSVDGREIRYVEHSRFDGAIRFGADQWNKLGSIAITQSESGTDLEFDDYKKCGDGTVAYYQLKSGTDLINFNICEMNKLNRFDRRGTSVHELGHALGLAHPGKEKHWCKDSIMYYTFCKASPNTPQRHDKEDYRELWGNGRSTAEQDTSGAERSSTGPSIIAPTYAFDARDERRLVGYATNVFIGRVAGEAGNEGAPLSGPGEKVLPQTQFSVEVLENVKGALGGTVTVNQTGGYTEEGRKARVEGSSLLEPGREYLFATGYDEEKGWYTVVAQPFGAVLIEGEERRAQIGERFERAEEEQIPYDPANR